MPPGHCSAIVMGHGVGVGLELGVGDGDGDGEGVAPQGNVSMVWQEYGSPFPVKHSMSSKMVMRHVGITTERGTNSSLHLAINTGRIARLR